MLSHGGHYLELPVEFECNLPPDLSVCLIVQDGANWWPQRWPISKTEPKDRYRGTVSLGAAGVRAIHIVKANTFGLGVVNYYKRVIERNEERSRYLTEKLKDAKVPEGFWEKIPSNYQSLQFNDLPNGLDPLASVTIEVRKPG